MGYFSKIYASELPHRAKTVYMYLKDRCNAEGQCYPAIGTIARELNLLRRTVERAIKDLEKAGLLKKEQWWRENGGRRDMALWRILRSKHWKIIIGRKRNTLEVLFFCMGMPQHFVDCSQDYFFISGS